MILETALIGRKWMGLSYEEGVVVNKNLPGSTMAHRYLASRPKLNIVSISARFISIFHKKTGAQYWRMNPITSPMLLLP